MRSRKESTNKYSNCSVSACRDGLHTFKRLQCRVGRKLWVDVWFFQLPSSTRVHLHCRPTHQCRERRRHATSLGKPNNALSIRQIELVNQFLLTSNGSFVVINSCKYATVSSYSAYQSSIDARRGPSHSLRYFVRSELASHHALGVVSGVRLLSSSSTFSEPKAASELTDDDEVPKSTLVRM